MSVELRDSYQAIYQRAVQQMGLGESQEAIDSLLRIIKRLSRLRPETLQRKANLQQTLVASWNAVTQFLSWEERYQEAIDLTAEIQDRLPDPTSGQIRIASLTIENGKAEEGLAALGEIAREQDDFDTWVALASELRGLGRYEEAIDAYQSALARAGSNDDAVLANMALFVVHREAENVPEALDAWKMSLVLEPDVADQAHQVYGWLIRAGLLDEAAPYLEREPAPVRRTFYEGLADWQADRQDAARRKWQLVVDMDEQPESDADIEALMEAALRLGNPEIADGVAQTRFLAGDLVSIRAEVLRGIAKLMLGQEKQALSHLTQAHLRWKRSSRTRSGLASDQWELLTQLVPDEEITANVAHLFNTGT